jgi:hypothetical protein
MRLQLRQPSTAHPLQCVPIPHTHTSQPETASVWQASRLATYDQGKGAGGKTVAAGLLFGIVAANSAAAVLLTAPTAGSRRTVMQAS